jgi:hypothetical protein
MYLWCSVVLCAVVCCAGVRPICTFADVREDGRPIERLQLPGCMTNILQQPQRAPVANSCAPKLGLPSIRLACGTGGRNHRGSHLAAMISSVSSVTIGHAWCSCPAGAITLQRKQRVTRRRMQKQLLWQQSARAGVYVDPVKSMHHPAVCHLQCLLHCPTSRTEYFRLSAQRPMGPGNHFLSYSKQLKPHSGLS